MSKSLEEKDSPALKARLQTLGFEQVQFEPKISNRFIVKIEGLPSYVVRGVRLPTYGPTGWSNGIELECYNPIQSKIEETAIALVNQSYTNIKIQILTPTAHVDTEWDIIGINAKISFGNWNWSNNGDPNLIYIRFEIDSAKVSYPTE